MHNSQIKNEPSEIPYSDIFVHKFNHVLWPILSGTKINI